MESAVGFQDLLEELVKTERISMVDKSQQERISREESVAKLSAGEVSFVNAKYEMYTGKPISAESRVS